MHSAGTTIEGEWDEVMDLVGQWHQKVHEMGISRVQSSVRIGTRTDKVQTAEDKIRSVEQQLQQRITEDEA